MQISQSRNFNQISLDSSDEMAQAVAMNFHWTAAMINAN